jgi:hypothetical protein
VSFVVHRFCGLHGETAPTPDFYASELAAYFFGQLPGEHIGVGAPPAAKDEVDTAPKSTKVATIKRSMFFIGKILRGDRAHSITNIFFWRVEIRSVRKTRDGKFMFVGLPTMRNRGSNVRSCCLVAILLHFSHFSPLRKRRHGGVCPRSWAGSVRRLTDDVSPHSNGNGWKSILVAGRATAFGSVPAGGSSLWGMLLESLNIGAHY